MNILNAKGRPFSWSHSAVNDFLGCPHRYAARRFFCTVVDEKTEESLWGDRVHKALEERIRDKKPLPEGMTAYENWARVLEALPGEFHFEKEFAVDQRLEPCGWFDKTAYGRVRIDLLILDEETKTAIVIDYKTGKPKDDAEQLRLSCWFLSKFYPWIETFKYRYIWLKVGKPTGGELTRREAMSVFTGTVEHLKRMEQAWVNEGLPYEPERTMPRVVPGAGLPTLEEKR
jgi:RecB family exonuclease